MLNKIITYLKNQILVLYEIFYSVGIFFNLGLAFSSVFSMPFYFIRLPYNFSL